MTQDTDLRPVSVPCVVDEPGEARCAPEPYVSPLAWDAADNSIFRPLTRVFAVDPAGPAVNVNALDEVPNSAWFTNRLGIRRPPQEELLRGACQPDEMLDPSAYAPGSWLIDKGKPNGSTPGFRVRIGERKYMLKADPNPRSTAASSIGAAIYHTVGFNTSCEQVIYVDPALFTLKPGLTATDNSGISRPFDRAALEKVLDVAPRRGKLLRMQASAWLPGFLLGPFKYEGTRSDDPNDVIAHQERRDLRGARLLAAWVDHFDAREQNSMDSWIAVDDEEPASSPGYVRHYYLDLSDCFGSEWAWDEISRRLGRSYLLDWGDMAYDFATLGIPSRPWDEVERTPGFEIFGYFHYRDFVPENWKNEYPNPAFSRATEHDNAWMARILARFEREDIDALVTLGHFEDKAHEGYLAEVLEKRLQRILERYLLRLSPIADLHMESGDVVCGTDLARRRHVRADVEFHYTARLEHPTDRRAPLGVRVDPDGEVCVGLPRVAAASGISDDAPERYVVVRLDNGASKYPLLAHLYDLGPKRGYRVVGLERPETDEAEP